tara:strand:- start:919 stop:1884 length:966 start_codon:yes stop_codon:yes gene_type:complete
MAIRFGRNAFVNLSDAESTYGDSGGLSFNVYSKIYSCTLSKSVERTQKTFLTTSDAGFSRGFFDVQTNCGGSVEVPLMYDGIGLWFHYATGATPVTSGGGPYTHAYKPTIPLPSFQVKFQRGSGSMEQFKGCMVSTMSIACATGEEAKVSFEIIAQDANNRVGAITPTFGSGAQVFHHQADASALRFTPSGSPLEQYTLRSFEFNLDNKLEDRRKLGSLLTESPDTNDIREVRLSCVADLEDNLIYNHQIAGTQGLVVVHFSSGADEFQIQLKNAVLLSYEDNVTSVGRVERTFEFQGYSDSSNEAFEITCINGSASPTAN